MTTTQAHPRQGRKKNSQGALLREFLKSTSTSASIAPSGRKLAERMIDGIDFSKVRSIVEYGPGTGVFTKVIIERLPKGWSAGQGQFIAIEYNANLAKMLAPEFPTVKIVADSAANVGEICKSHGIEQGSLDVVISGLGWALFPPELATQILESTAATLRPGGEFRTFAYHIGLVRKSAWHLRSELRRLFTTVEVGRGVWSNVPPAFVYRCVK